MSQLRAAEPARILEPVPSNLDVIRGEKVLLPWAPSADGVDRGFQVMRTFASRCPVGGREQFEPVRTFKTADEFSNALEPGQGLRMADEVELGRFGGITENSCEIGGHSVGGYSVKLVLPGRGAPDPYDTRVEINENGCPWPIVLHFIYVEEDNGSGGYRNVGFELRRPLAKIDESTPVEAIPAIDPEVLERIALNYARYLRVAQGAIVWDDREIDVELMKLRRAGRTRRGLGKEFFRRVGADYTAHVRNRGPRGAVAAIARAYQVDPSTASRWIARAREGGFVEVEGGSEQ